MSRLQIVPCNKARRCSTCSDPLHLDCFHKTQLQSWRYPGDELSRAAAAARHQQEQAVRRASQRRQQYHDMAFLRKRMYTWPHVEGSIVYEELFPRYLMPNGRRAFFYYQSGMLTDAMEASIDKSIPRPDIDMLAFDVSIERSLATTKIWRHRE